MDTQQKFDIRQKLQELQKMKQSYLKPASNQQHIEEITEEERTPESRSGRLTNDEVNPMADVNAKMQIDDIESFQNSSIQQSTPKASRKLQSGKRFTKNERRALKNATTGGPSSDKYVSSDRKMEQQPLTDRQEIKAPRFEIQLPNSVGSDLTGATTQRMPTRQNEQATLEKATNSKRHNRRSSIDTDQKVKRPNNRLQQNIRQPKHKVEDNANLEDLLNDDLIHIFKDEDDDIGKKATQDGTAPESSRRSELYSNDLEQITLKPDYRPLFNDKHHQEKLDNETKKRKDETEKKMKMAKELQQLEQMGKPKKPNINQMLDKDNYALLLKQQELKFNQLQVENERLKHFLPDSYTEMRLRERQLQERMSRYEQSIIDYENEKKALYETLKKKDEDIQFIKGKYEEANALWHQENIEKQKLEAVIEQQYRESMELDTMRRRSEDEKGIARKKNESYKSEIEDLIKENRKLVAEKTTLNSRLQSLRAVNKQLDKRIESHSLPIKKNPLYKNTESRLKNNEQWAADLEEKLSFTVEKFEEQNQRFMQCGRELAEAHEYIEQLESQAEEQKEENRIKKIQLTALKAENLGEKGGDNMSQRTGIMSQATKFTENIDDQMTVQSRGQHQEKIALEFLQKQNEAQLKKIQQLEMSQNNNNNYKYKTNEDLIRQINQQNMKVHKLSEQLNQIQDKRVRDLSSEQNLQTEIGSLKRKLIEQGSMAKKQSMSRLSHNLVQNPKQHDVSKKYSSGVLAQRDSLHSNPISPRVGMGQKKSSRGSQKIRQSQLQFNQQLHAQTIGPNADKNESLERMLRNRSNSKSSKGRNNDDLKGITANGQGTNGAEIDIINQLDEEERRLQDQIYDLQRQEQDNLQISQKKGESSAKLYDQILKKTNIRK